MTTQTYDGSTNSVVWVEVTYDGASDNLILDTETTTGIDTEIGIYDANGDFIANNDDGGTGTLSSLTQSGLPAGTYYVVAGGFNTTFGTTGFDVTSTSTATGNLVINGASTSNVDQPIVTFEAVCQTVATGETNFYIDINATDLGTVNPSGFNVLVDDADSGTDITATGITQIGPFPSGTPVSVTIEGIDEPCSIQSATGLDAICEPPTTVATFDLAGGCDSDMTTQTYDGSTNGVVWVEVIYDGNSDDLILDTETTTGIDTEIGIYDANGNLIANDDDGGTGTLSSLTLSGIPAGTYYVAAGGFNTIFGPTGFGATSTSTATSDLVINGTASTAFSTPTVAFSATCQLGDETNFYVDIDLTDLGIDNPSGYNVLVNDVDSGTDITAIGMTQMGPYSSGTPVTITLEGMDEICVISNSTALDADCSCDPLAVEAVADGGFCPGSAFTLDATLNDVLPQIGYTKDDACSTAFIDISATGTELVIIDDDEVGISTVNSYTLYNTTYTDFTVADNGGVIVGSTTGNLPAGNGTANQLVPTLFPHWDDGDSDIGNIYWEEVGNTLIISWVDRPLYNGAGTSAGDGITYQIQWDATTGVITFVYADLNAATGTTDGGSATVGISSGNGVDFDEHSVDTPLGSPTCISYTPLPDLPCTFVSWITDLNDPVGSEVSTTQSTMVSPAAPTTYYAVVDCNGFLCTDDVLVTPFSNPTVTFTSPADLCIDAGLVALTTGSPAGGTYSGNGVVDNGDGTFDFDPATAGANTHTLTYSFTDANGCSVSETDDIIVFALPTVTFTAPANLCIDDGAVTLTGSPAGGTFSGNGVVDNGDGTFDFDPATAGANAHTITYSFTDGNNCTATATDDLTVFDVSSISFTAPADICSNAGLVALTGTPTGGTFSGNGVVDNSDGTFDFDPATAGVNTHTITYSFTNGSGCSASTTDDIEVFDIPVVTFASPVDLCIDAGLVALTTGTPAGGTYSGNGVVDNGDGTFDFDPATAGANTHTITYSFTDGNNCTATATDDVEVFALPTITFVAPADLCIDAGLTSLSASPSGGTFSGTGVIDNGDGTFDFDPATAGANTHTITYAFTDANGCAASTTDDIEVFDLPTASASSDSPVCETATLTLMETSSNGVSWSWTGPDNFLSTDQNPTITNVGTIAEGTYTVEITDANGCTGTTTTDVIIFPASPPSITGTPYGPYCIAEGAVNLTATPTGGTWSGAGIIDAASGLFEPASAGAGTHTITYTFVDANGCTNTSTATTDIMVDNTTCTVDYTLVDPCTCLNNATPVNANSGAGGDDGQFSEIVTLTDVNGTPIQAGQTWSIIGAIGSYDEGNIPATGQSPLVPIATDGSVALAYNGTAYEIEFVHVDAQAYTITIEGPLAAGDPSNVTLQISNVCIYPEPAFETALDLSYCQSAPAIALGATESTGAILENLSFSIDNNTVTEFDPSTLSPGNHTVTLTYDAAADSNNGYSPDAQAMPPVIPAVNPAAPGCIQEVVDNVSIQAAPVVTINVDDSSVCTGDPTFQIDAVVVGGLAPFTIAWTGDTSPLSATDIEDPIFDTSVAGDYNLIFTVTDANGCFGEATIMIGVTSAQDPVIDPLGPFCENDAPIQLTASPAGGTWSGIGVSSTGMFDPSVPGAGVHQIGYLSGADGCLGITQSSVTVEELPSVEAGNPQNICASGTVDLSGIGANIAGTATDGNWSSSGDGTFDTMTYSTATTYTPGANDISNGSFTLTLTSDDPAGNCGSGTDDVEITIRSINCGNFPWGGN